MSGTTGGGAAGNKAESLTIFELSVTEVSADMRGDGQMYSLVIFTHGFGKGP